MRSVPFGAVCTGLIFAGVVGCAKAQELRPEDASNLAHYDDELAACRAKGKAAGSYAVYEACANEVDRKYGRTTTTTRDAPMGAPR